MHSDSMVIHMQRARILDMQAVLLYIVWAMPVLFAGFAGSGCQVTRLQGRDSVEVICEGAMTFVLLQRK